MTVGSERLMWKILTLFWGSYVCDFAILKTLVKRLTGNFKKNFAKLWNDPLMVLICHFVANGWHYKILISIIVNMRGDFCPAIGRPCEWDDDMFLRDSTSLLLLIFIIWQEFCVQAQLYLQFIDVSEFICADKCSDDYGLLRTCLESFFFVKDVNFNLVLI